MSQIDIVDYLKKISPDRRTVRQIAFVLGVGVQSVHSNVKKICRQSRFDPDLDGFCWVLEDFGGLSVRKYWWER